MMSSMLLLAWSGKMMFVHLVVAQQAQIGSVRCYRESGHSVRRG